MNIIEWNDSKIHYLMQLLRDSVVSVNDYTKQIKIEQKLYVIWRYIAHKIAFNKRITNKWSPAQHI